MAHVKAAAATAGVTRLFEAISGKTRGSAPPVEREPMPIVGATPVDREIDGAHDPVEYLDAPVASEPTHEQIRERAYHFWVRRGSPYGDPGTDWMEAERSFRLVAQ